MRQRDGYKFHHNWYVEGVYDIQVDEVRSGDKYANNVLDN
jgi:hypothetical protein